MLVGSWLGDSTVVLEAWQGEMERGRQNQKKLSTIGHQMFGYEG